MKTFIARTVGSILTSAATVVCLAILGANPPSAAASPPDSLASPRNLEEVEPPSSMAQPRTLEPGVAQSRSLSKPHGLSDPLTSDSNAIVKPSVLIYYANETAPDDVEASWLASQITWLRATVHPELIARAESLEHEMEAFPAQVDEEIAAIKNGHAASERSPAVILVTNRLARQGRLEYLTSNQPGVVQTAELSLPSPRAGLYQSYPLAARESLEIVLARAAELFDPQQHEFTLVTKSHGTPRLALITFYQSVGERVDRAMFVDHAQRVVDSQLSTKLRTARPLFSAPNDQVVDSERRGLVELDGVLFWEQVGKLQARADEKGAYLCDRLGRPFVDALGRRVEIVDSQLRLSSTETPLHDAEGNAAELLAMIVRHGDVTASEAAELPPSRWPAYYPLLHSPRLAGASVRGSHLVIPATESQRLAFPVVTDRAEAVEATSDASWTAHCEASRRLLAATKVPVVDGDGIVAPLVAPGTMTSPLLAVSKWLGDARLSPDDDFSTLSPEESSTLSPEESSTLSPEESSTLSPEESSTLSPDEASTLSPDEASTLSPDEASTLSPDEASTLSIEEASTLSATGDLTALPNGSVRAADKGASMAPQFGITKQEYLGTLQSMNKQRGMYFRILFLESCQSEISDSEVAPWHVAGTPAFAGQIWTSDARGLKLSTIDYGALFESLDGAPHFGEAIRSALQAKFDEEAARRAVLEQ